MGHMGWDTTDYPTIIDLVRGGRIDLSYLITHRVFSLDEVNKSLDMMEKMARDRFRIVVMV